MTRHLARLQTCLLTLATHPRTVIRQWAALTELTARLSKAEATHLETFVDSGLFSCRGRAFSSDYADATSSGEAWQAPPNPLTEYWRDPAGQEVFKWEHYFDIYHRHFSRFRGRAVNVLEVGIGNGGSLKMWRQYFGDASNIYGVDVDESLKKFETDGISVFIGDQEDRQFWRSLLAKVGPFDIVIDDGGHLPRQQQVTLEEILPRIRSGGVYLCEDIHGASNAFNAFVAGLTSRLNDYEPADGQALQSKVFPWQSAIHSVHFYPYVVVIEKNSQPPRLSTVRA